MGLNLALCVAFYGWVANFCGWCFCCWVAELALCGWHFWILRRNLAVKFGNGKKEAADSSG
ncbi:hypothetical protein [Campylobacter lanienae]|uniref:hypothetical protein n=1 Tax=Campylobacter lanienae TaxID=75658 RepID=UPI00112F9F6D|nr:hypothetical protein [Campylobacter lanienae]